MLHSEHRQDFLIRKNEEPIKILAFKEDEAKNYIGRVTRRFPKAHWEILPRMLPIQTD
ncbi:hypothetical protein [Kiloniella antarctica]|uniref:Uncharacterized protein n=1 Tax=Kiloniella antarctica TaxID=1550907 RepID=A0ABW5BFA7_9PROT